jgi:conjugal transfer pilus assembly protein TraF
MRWFYLLMASLCTLPITVFADDINTDDLPPPIAVPGQTPERLGWHFYYDIEPEEVADEQTPESPQQEQKQTDKEKPSKTASSSSASLPEAFSTQWFQDNYTKIEAAAIDNPTRENIRALLVTERMMFDKSEVFARTKKRIAESDPLLQDNSRIPLHGAGKAAMFKYKKEQTKAAMDEIGKKVGFIFFYDGNCIFCHQMINHVNRISGDYGWEARVVAKNIPTDFISGLNPNIPVIKSTAIAESLGIKRWPSVVLLNPNQTEQYLITQGVMSFSTMERTILNVALETKLLSDDWFYKIFPQEKGLIAPSQFADLPKDLADDPIKLINYSLDLLEDPAGTKEYTIPSEESDDE